MTVLKHDYKKAFSLKFFEGYGKTFSKNGIKVTSFELGFLNSAKLFKNFDGLISNIETVHDYNRGETSGFKDGYDAFKALIDINQNTSFLQYLKKFSRMRLSSLKQFWKRLNQLRLIYLNTVL